MIKMIKVINKKCVSLRQSRCRTENFYCYCRAICVLQRGTLWGRAARVADDYSHAGYLTMFLPRLLGTNRKLWEDFARYRATVAHAPRSPAGHSPVCRRARAGRKETRLNGPALEYDLAKAMALATGTRRI